MPLRAHTTHPSCDPASLLRRGQGQPITLASRRNRTIEHVLWVNRSWSSYERQHRQMACSPHDDVRLGEQRSSDRIQPGKAVFTNANNRQPFLHRMLPQHHTDGLPPGWL